MFENIEIRLLSSDLDLGSRNLEWIIGFSIFEIEESNNKNIKGPPSLNFIITIFWKLGILNNQEDENHYLSFDKWDVQEMLDAVEARNNKIELVDKYTVDTICSDYDISFTYFKLILIPIIFNILITPDRDGLIFTFLILI